MFYCNTRMCLDMYRLKYFCQERRDDIAIEYTANVEIDQIPIVLIRKF